MSCDNKSELKCWKENLCFIFISTEISTKIFIASSMIYQHKGCNYCYFSDLKTLIKLLKDILIISSTAVEYRKNSIKEATCH